MNPNNRKYHLVLCELHYYIVHGKSERSAQDIDGHYLHIQNLTRYVNDLDNDTDSDEDVVNTQHTQRIQRIQMPIEYYRIIRWYRSVYHEIGRLHVPRCPHPIIRNYANIIRRPNYIQPEIAQIIALKTGEIICILKTFWLRIFQRICRKYVAKLRKKQKHRCKISSILHREIFGSYPRLLLKQGIASQP